MCVDGGVLGHGEDAEGLEGDFCCWREVPGESAESSQGVPCGGRDRPKLHGSDEGGSYERQDQGRDGSQDEDCRALEIIA